MATTITSGFGSMWFGTGFFGTALGEGEILQVQNVLAVRENVVRVEFSLVPKFTGLGTSDDAANPKNYVLIPDTTTQGKDEQPPRPVTPVLVEQVVGSNGLLLDVTLDRPMTPFPAVYSIQISNLIALASQFAIPPPTPVVLPTTVSPFPAVFKELVPQIPRRQANNRDIANPTTFDALTAGEIPVADNQVNDEQLGVYQVDARGDLAIDQGLVSYKKRVIRRLMTRKGSFSHLPNYGIGLPQSMKQLALPSTILKLTTDAEEQILFEPETISSDVSLIVIQPGVFRFVVKARTLIKESVDVTIPIRLPAIGV